MLETTLGFLVAVFPGRSALARAQAVGGGPSSRWRLALTSSPAPWQWAQEKENSGVRRRREASKSPRSFLFPKKLQRGCHAGLGIFVSLLLLF